MPDDAPPLKLTFRPLPDPDDVPVAVRIRRLLKYALRVCRLRLVAMEGTIPDDPPRKEQS